MDEVVCKWLVVYSAMRKLVNNNATVKKQVFKASISYTCGITKVDQIFFALLVEKVIKLNEGHRIPKTNDLKRKEYCK